MVSDNMVSHSLLVIENSPSLHKSKKGFPGCFFIIYQDHANKMNIFYLLLSKNIHISIQLIVRILRIYRGEGVLGGLLDTSPCP